MRLKTSKSNDVSGKWEDIFTGPGMRFGIGLEEKKEEKWEGKTKGDISRSSSAFIKKIQLYGAERWESYIHASINFLPQLPRRKVQPKISQGKKWRILDSVIGPSRGDWRYHQPLRAVPLRSS